MSNKRSTSLRGLIAHALKHVEGLLDDGSDFKNMRREHPLPLSENEVNAFIKKRIRRYVESWILPNLRTALKKAEGKKRRAPPSA